MGAFAQLFRRDSPTRSPKKTPLSTLNIPLPSPEPLSPLATEPSLGIRTHRHGPRAPYNVYYPPRWNGATLEGDFAALSVGRDPAKPSSEHAYPPASRPSLPPRRSSPPPLPLTRPPFLVRASASAPGVSSGAVPRSPPAHPSPPGPSTSRRTSYPVAPQKQLSYASAPPTPAALPPPYIAAVSSPTPVLPLRPSPARAQLPPPRPPRRSGVSPPTPEYCTPASLNGPTTPSPKPPNAAQRTARTSVSRTCNTSEDDELLPHPSTLSNHLPRSPRSPRSPVKPAPPRVPGSPSPSPSPRKRLVPDGATQCAALTARSTRCTRFVVGSLPALPVPAVDGSEEGVEGGAPAYCAQHARGKLVDSGCFVHVRAASGEREGEVGERWVRYADWISDELPDETKALLRHYMALAVSDRDCDGFLYIHELIKCGSSPSLHPTAPALIKLGRSLRPLARLAQWRASCPSREPIVRFFAPALGGGAAEDAAGAGRNHHRWERLCLVELAGRARAHAGKGERQGRERCEDCGKTHVECFLLPRSSVAPTGSEGAQSWTVREVVERWARWCDALG